MNSKMTASSKLLTTKHKQKRKQTKQTSTTVAESQKWRSHESLSAAQWEVERGRKGTENK